MRREDAYHIATVEFIEDEDLDARSHPSLVSQVASLHREVEALTRRCGRGAPQGVAPVVEWDTQHKLGMWSKTAQRANQDTRRWQRAFSYAAAAALPAEPSELQGLLEIPCTQDRLAEEVRV